MLYNKVSVCHILTLFFCHLTQNDIYFNLAWNMINKEVGK
jgi:hypothetical protein